MTTHFSSDLFQFPPTKVIFYSFNLRNFVLSFFQCRIGGVVFTSHQWEKACHLTFLLRELFYNIRFGVYKIHHQKTPLQSYCFFPQKIIEVDIYFVSESFQVSLYFHLRRLSHTSSLFRRALKEDYISSVYIKRTVERNQIESEPY